MRVRRPRQLTGFEITEEGDSMAPSFVVDGGDAAVFSISTSTLAAGPSDLEVGVSLSPGAAAEDGKEDATKRAGVCSPFRILHVKLKLFWRGLKGELEGSAWL